MSCFHKLCLCILLPSPSPLSHSHVPLRMQAHRHVHLRQMSLSAIYSTDEQVLELFLDNLPTIHTVKEIAVLVSTLPISSVFLMGATDSWTKGLFYGNNAFTFDKSLNVGERSVMNVILLATEIQENGTTNAPCATADDELSQVERCLFFSLHLKEMNPSRKFAFLSSADPQRKDILRDTQIIKPDFIDLDYNKESPFSWLKHTLFLLSSSCSAS